MTQTSVQREAGRSTWRSAAAICLIAAFSMAIGYQARPRLEGSTASPPAWDRPVVAQCLLGNDVNAAVASAAQRDVSEADKIETLPVGLAVNEHARVGTRAWVTTATGFKAVVPAATLVNCDAETYLLSDGARRTCAELVGDAGFDTFVPHHIPAQMPLKWFAARSDGTVMVGAEFYGVLDEHGKPWQTGDGAGLDTPVLFVTVQALKAATWDCRFK